MGPDEIFDFSGAGEKKGLGKLFGSGSGQGSAQAVGMGIEGIASFANLYGAERNMYDKTIRERDVTFGGVPTYTGVSSIRQEQAAIDAGQAGKGLIGQGAMSGAKVGAAVGSFFPGLGTVIGAGAGALAGTIGGLFAKKKVKREAEELKAEGRQAFEQTQQDYNRVIGDYYGDVDQSRQAAQDERNYQQRAFNIDNRLSPFSGVI
jgi:hypothetical protein